MGTNEYSQLASKSSWDSQDLWRQYGVQNGPFSQVNPATMSYKEQDGIIYNPINMIRCPF